MWIGMESEMVHEKVPCCWLHLAYIPLFFVLAGLRAGTVLLWAVSIGKKMSKPKDNLVNDLPVLANLV